MFTEGMCSMNCLWRVDKRTWILEGCMSAISMALFFSTINDQPTGKRSAKASYTKKCRAEEIWSCITVHSFVSSLFSFTTRVVIYNGLTMMFVRHPHDRLKQLIWVDPEFSVEGVQQMRQRLWIEQKTYFHPFYFPSVHYVPLAAQLEFHCCIYLFKGSNQLEFATQCGPKNVSNRKSTDLNRYIKKNKVIFLIV